MLILMIVGCNRSSSSNSKHDDFILNWTLLDAVYFDDKPDAMREAFNNEAVNVTSLLQSVENGQVNIGDDALAWNEISSKSPIIDYSEHVAKEEKVCTYDITKINTDKSKTAFFAVGCADGIKIWLNGELILENFATRLAGIDQDRIAVKLLK